MGIYDESARNIGDWEDLAQDAIRRARHELRALSFRVGVVFHSLTEASEYTDANALGGMAEDDGRFLEWRDDGEGMTEACAHTHARVLGVLDTWLRLGSPEPQKWHALGEFNASYHVPAEVFTEPGIVDTSWHNDVCPSFSFDELQQHEAGQPERDVRLWVQHVEPGLREGGEDVPRFAVYDHRGERDLYEGEDLGAALEALRAARREVR